MSDACPELDSGRKHVGFKTTGPLDLFPSPIIYLRRAKRAGMAFAG